MQPWATLISLIKPPTEMSRKFKYCVLFTSIILHNYCIRRRLPYNILPHILNDRDESVRHYDENEKARVRFFLKEKINEMKLLENLLYHKIFVKFI